jgi:nucleoside-diphosphate-sugar epimerase
VGTDQEISIKELVAELGHVMGRSVIAQASPLQPGGTSRRCPSIVKLRQLGYSPRISLEEGLRRTVRWYVEQEGRIVP